MLVLHHSCEMIPERREFQRKVIRNLWRIRNSRTRCEGQSWETVRSLLRYKIWDLRRSLAYDARLPFTRPMPPIVRVS